MQRNDNKKILALDLGFRNTGIAIFEDGQLKCTGILQINMSKEHVLFETYGSDNIVIRSSLIDIPESKYKNEKIKSALKIAKSIVDTNLPVGDFDTIIAETTYFGSQSANAAVYMAIGATFWSLIYGDKMHIIQPQAVKRFIKKETGLTKVSKSDVMDWVYKKMPNVEIPLPHQKMLHEHIFDAIAAYITWMEATDDIFENHADKSN